MHFLIVYCEPFSNKEQVAVVFPLKSFVDVVTGSEAMIDVSFSTLLLRCLMKRVGRSALS